MIELLTKQYPETQFSYPEALDVLSKMEPVTKNGATLNVGDALRIVEDFYQDYASRITYAQSAINDTLNRYRMVLTARLQVSKDVVEKLAKAFEGEDPPSHVLLDTHYWELVPVEKFKTPNTKKGESNG